MQVIQNILITFEIILGLSILLITIFQKSNSDGLISKVSNPFNNSSQQIAPATKITGIFIIFFMLNSIALTIIKSKQSKISLAPLSESSQLINEKNDADEE
jgi:preprotein translocase subunit SecG